MNNLGYVIKDVRSGGYDEGHHNAPVCSAADKARVYENKGSADHRAEDLTGIHPERDFVVIPVEYGILRELSISEHDEAMREITTRWIMDSPEILRDHLDGKG
ncbi:MAG: hypothetical protein WD960_06955 [Gemmatimonadota bacterium]